MSAPECPKCRGEATAYDRDFRPMPAPALWCAACGHRWDGTPEERAAAEAADVAWLTPQRAPDADELTALRAQVAALTTERDAAHASHAALVAAVREERAAERVLADAFGVPTDPRLQLDAVMETLRFTMSAGDMATIESAGDATLACRAATDALLSGAPSGYVSAEVVREYLARADNCARFSDLDEGAFADAARVAEDTARTALDAALDAAGGGA